MRRLVESDTIVTACSSIMNKNLSPLPIDLNKMLAGRVVATGMTNGASLKADDCVDIIVWCASMICGDHLMKLGEFLGKESSCCGRCDGVTR